MRLIRKLFLQVPEENFPLILDPTLGPDRVRLQFEKNPEKKPLRLNYLQTCFSHQLQRLSIPVTSDQKIRELQMLQKQLRSLLRRKAKGDLPYGSRKFLRSFDRLLAGFFPSDRRQYSLCLRNGKMSRFRNLLSSGSKYAGTPMATSDCFTFNLRVPCTKSHHLKITE